MKFQFHKMIRQSSTYKLKPKNPYLVEFSLKFRIFRKGYFHKFRIPMNKYLTLVRLSFDHSKDIKIGYNGKRLATSL